jgi:hypothetical protein
MYTDHLGTQEYPFEGMFYKVVIDESLPLDQRDEVEISIFSTKFDMAEGAALSTETFSIYFPFNAYKDSIVIYEGILFKGDIYGASIKGRVLGIYPSQIGGCKVLLTRS